MKFTTFAVLPVVGAAAIAAAVPASAAQPAAVPGVANGTQVVAGTLHPATFQASLDSAWAKKVAEVEAARVAAEQAAAEAARVAAEQAAAEQAAAEQAAAQAAAEQAAQAAPQATYSAPQAPTYSEPQPAYTAPAEPAYSGGGDASAWANSAKSMSVKNCESGNNYSTNTGNGYYGAWQFDIPSWLANGGGAYAPRPDLAPAWAQDQVAYNYYQNAGWGPWSCG